MADEVEGEAATERKAGEFLIEFVVICSPDALALLFQQGAEDIKILLFIDFIEHSLLDIRIDAFLPKGLLHLPSAPFVIADLVFDEGTGITFIVDVAFLNETVDDAVLYGFIDIEILCDQYGKRRFLKTMKNK